MRLAVLAFLFGRMVWGGPPGPSGRCLMRY